jgi:drug/metabolite transporter (DMT)-like permease
MTEVDSKRRRTGLLLIVVAAVLWSTSGFFAKAPIFDDWPQEVRGNLLVFWRAAFASLVLIFLVRKVTWTWRLIPGSIAFVAMNWAFLGALVYGEATLAIWLQYTAPVWVFLGSWYLFRERPKPSDWLLFAFAAVGVTLIISGQAVGGMSYGLLLGVLSGLFFGGVVLSLRWLRDVDSAWTIFLYHMVTAIVFLPYLLQSQVFPQGQQWVYLACFGPIQMGVPYVLFARGVKSVTSHEASGLSLLEPILVPVWVFFAWRSHAEYQPPDVSTLVGGGLILAGLLLRYRKNSSRDSTQVE